MANPFPASLVLTMTTLYRDNGCASVITDNLNKGNTFDVAFDMTQAPAKPGENGLVYLENTPQRNFEAADRVELANEGLSDAMGFMSIATTKAHIYDTPQNVTRAYLVGRPHGTGVDWSAGVIIGDGCIVTTGNADQVVARLSA